VSQIWSLIFFPSSSIVLILKSIPMVEMKVVLKASSEKRNRGRSCLRPSRRSATAWTDNRTSSPSSRSGPLTDEREEAAERGALSPILKFCYEACTHTYRIVTWTVFTYCLFLWLAGKDDLTIPPPNHTCHSLLQEVLISPFTLTALSKTMWQKRCFGISELRP
jgi:hypothetical protein